MLVLVAGRYGLQGPLRRGFLCAASRLVQPMLKSFLLFTLRTKWSRILLEMRQLVSLYGGHGRISFLTTFTNWITVTVRQNDRRRGAGHRSQSLLHVKGFRSPAPRLSNLSVTSLVYDEMLLHAVWFITPYKKHLIRNIVCISENLRNSNMECKENWGNSWAQTGKETLVK